MAIELRTNKASALTYNEMDRNFSSFFYSASVDTDTNRLYLWYTGSANLNMSPGDNFGPARSVEIELQPTTGNNPTLVVAGNPRNIQFRHAIDPRLDADTGFIYTTSQQLGIGAATPNANTKIHAVGTGIIPATLRLETTSTGNANRRAVVDFYQGATFMGTMGRDNYNDNNLYIKTYLGIAGLTKQTPPGNLIINIGSNTNSGAWTNVGLGIGTLAPQYPLQVQGNGYITGKLAVGDVPSTAALNVFQTAQTGTSLGDFQTIAKFGIIPGASVDSLKILSVRQLAGGNNWWSNGMRIQQDVDGTYRTYIQFSGEGNLHGFSIGTGQSTSPHKPGDIGIQERLRIDSSGNVTINKPVANAKFDVNGDTIVTGSFTVTQNATVKGNLIGQGTATISGNTSIGGTATVTGVTTLLNIPQDVAGANTKILTATAGGQIQYITSIFPKGGIVMWSGTIATIPTGWQLCNGVGEWSPGNPIPDLRERFIVGAGGDNTGVVTKNYATATFQRQADTWYGTTGAISTAIGADGEYNVVTAGTFYQGTTTSGNTVTGTVFAGPVGGVNGIPYFVYQKTTGNKHYFIYSVIEQNYILMQGEFTGAGTIANYGIASTSTYSAGKYFRLPPNTRIASADYNRDVNGTWVNGKRPDLVGLYYYDTLGYNVGDRGGFNEVELEVAQMPSHNHPVRMHYDSSAGGDAPTEFNTSNQDEGSTYITPYTTTDPTGQGLPHENRPPYYALAFIIYTGA